MAWINSWNSTNYHFPVAQTVKRLSTMWETRIRSLGPGRLLEKEMVTTAVLIAWKIPRTQRSLVGYSPCGHKESDMTERLYLTHNSPNMKLHSNNLFTFKEIKFLIFKFSSKIFQVSCQYYWYQNQTKTNNKTLDQYYISLIHI